MRMKSFHLEIISICAALLMIVQRGQDKERQLKILDQAYSDLHDLAREVNKGGLLDDQPIVEERGV